MVLGERSQALEVARRGRNAAHIAGHRLQDHSGVIGLEVCTNRLQIIEGRKRGHRGWNPR